MSPLSYFYVVGTGSFSVYEDEEMTETLEVGSSFGELVLVLSHPRSNTVKADTAGVLWILSSEIFHKCVSEGFNKMFEETISILRKVPIFNGLDEFHYALLAKAMHRMKVRAGVFVLSSIIYRLLNLIVTDIY